MIIPPIPPTPTPVRCCWHSRIFFCFSEKMTSLEISEMYFIKFDVFGQYLNNIWLMFVQQVSVQVYMSPINSIPEGGIRPPRPPQYVGLEASKLIDLYWISSTNQTFWRPPGRLIGRVWGADAPPGIKLSCVFSQPWASTAVICSLKILFIYFCYIIN